MLNGTVLNKSVFSRGQQTFLLALMCFHDIHGDVSSRGEILSISIVLIETKIVSKRER